MELYSGKLKKVLFLLLPLFVIVPLVFSLSSCSPPIDSEEVINSLLPNLWVFLSHIFASVILIVACIWLVWKPTKTTLAKRHDYIANEIRLAEKANSEAIKKLEEANNEKIATQSRIDELIDEAKNQAFEIVENSKIEAETQAKKIRDDAILNAQVQEKKDQKNFEKQVLDVAFEVSEAILQKEIKSKDNSKFIDDILKDLDGKLH